MPRFLPQFGFGKKEAIAKEVLDGAIRTLRAIGYYDDEIDKLLSAAIPSKAGDIDHNPIPEISIEVFSGRSAGNADRYQFEKQFEELECVQALQRLAKRQDRFWMFSSSADAQSALDCVTQALALGAQAQAWLLSNASNAGLIVGGLRDEWVKTATDAELDEEEYFIFFDDWRFKTQFPWDLVDTLSRHFAGKGDEEMLRSMATILDESEFILNRGIVERLELAKTSVMHFNTYRKYVFSLSGKGEMMRSDANNEYSNIHNLVNINLLDGWLDEIASIEDCVKVYKRSNRWRLEVN